MKFRRLFAYHRSHSLLGSCLVLGALMTGPSIGAAQKPSAPLRVVTAAQAADAHLKSGTAQQTCTPQARRRSAPSAGAEASSCQPEQAMSAFAAEINRSAVPAGAADAIAQPDYSLLTGGSSNAFSGFLDATSYPTMVSVASNITTTLTLSADFMNHGRKDIFTIDTASQIHLLANNGDGTFKAPVTSSGSVAGAYSTTYLSAVVVDYDRDGYPDVIARDGSNFRLTYFHNNHDGTFTLAKFIALPDCYAPAAFLMGDVTNDGVDDLTVFVTSYSSSSPNTTMQVLVYAGTGTGDFATTPTETDYTFSSADVIIPNGGALLANNGGRKSLYVEALSIGNYAQFGATVFALGLNGDGTFKASPYNQQDFVSADIYNATNSGELSLADLDRDGNPDITVAFGDGYIYTALGMPDGSFPQVVVANTAFTVYPESMMMVDINGDGFPDLVVKESTTLEVLPGLGTGIFGLPAATYTVSNSSSGASNSAPGSNMVYDDFTGDGVADVVYIDTTFNGYNSAVLMVGQDNGGFQSAVALPALTQLGYSPGQLYGEAMFDTNGDGYSDLIVLDTNGLGPYVVRTALSDGKGNFKLIQALAATQGSYTLGPVKGNYDFNGDGKQDLILDAYTTPAPYTYVHTLAVALSNGDGTFGTPVFLNTNGVQLANYVAAIAIGDINGDGIPDILAATGGGGDAVVIMTFLGKKDGTFQPAVSRTYGNSYTYQNLLLADFNGDGKLDLLLSDDGTLGSVLPEVSIIFGDNSGVFDPTKAVPLTSGLSIHKVLVGDLNKDGHPDIVLIARGKVSGSTVTTTDRGAIVYLNKGDGTFSRGTTYEVGTIGGTGLLADFNADGNLDLVFGVEYPWERADASNMGAQLLLGNGDGTFGAPSNIAVPPSVSFMAAGDLDGDGMLDLMTYSYYVGSIDVLRNVSGNGMTLTADSTAITTAQGVTLTATVTPSVSYRPTPTGTVTFSIGGTSLGSAPLLDGAATIRLATLPAGSDTVLATYSGDSHFATNAKGASVVIKVTAPVTATPDFTLAVPSVGLTVSSGGGGQVGFSVTANSAYSGMVTFAAQGLPANMSVSFSPAAPTLAASSVTPVTMNLSTSATTKASISPKTTSYFAFIAICFVAGISRRRRWLPHSLVLALAATGALIPLAGCSHSASTTTSAGDYTIVVTATPAVTGVSTKAFNVTVHVN